MDVDPRELTAGYSHARGRGVAAYWGVLHDGKAEVWRCAKVSGHRPHIIAGQAHQCARDELERRRQGAREVLRALHCAPCSVFWDLALLSAPGETGDPGSYLLRGQCPRCTGPGQQVKLAVLERSAR